MSKVILLTFIFLVSCMSPTDKGTITVTLESKKLAQPKISRVELINDQVVVEGENFLKLSFVKLNSQNLDIVSNTASKIVLSASSAINLALGTALELVVNTAHGASAVSVVFNLVDGSVTASKLSDMGASTGQFLKYNGTTWVPTTISSGLTYLGGYDASSNTPDVSLGGYSNGEYYIVSAAGSQDFGYGNGIISWNVGDWLVWNGVDFDQINNTVGVTSVNGSSGVITKSQIFSGSTLSDIGDVDTSGISAGKILKWDGSNWVIADDLSSGGASSVSSSEIIDGAIGTVDLDSAINTTLSQVGTNTSSISTNTSSISTNTTNITTNSADIATNAAAISTNASDISSNTTAIANRLPLAGGTMSGDIVFSGTQTFDGVDISVLETSVTGKLDSSDIDTDTGLTGNSDSMVPSQRAVKSYVDAQVLTAGTGDLKSDGSVSMSGDFDLGNNNLRFKSDNANYVQLKAPNSLGSNYSLILPSDDGASGQILSTDGSGNLAWINAATGSVTGVTVNPPLSATGTTSRDISISQANASTDGYLSSTDWNSFNSKVSTTTTVNGKALSSNVTLVTSDVAEGTNLYYTTARAKADTVVNSTAGSETDQAASVVAMKSYVGSSITSSISSKADKTTTINSQSLAGNVVLDTDDILEGSTSFYHTTGRARAAAVVNSTAGTETDQAASVAAMKNYVTTQTAGAGTGDLKADGSVAMTGNFDLGTQKIINGSGASLKGDASTTLTGTVEVSGTSLIGTGTAFTTELIVGDIIDVAGNILKVATIADDTTATVSVGATIASGQTLIKLNSILAITKSDNSDALSVLSNGYVGIGTTTPATQLQVTNGAGFGVLMIGDNSATNNHHITHESSDQSFRIYDGIFGLGVTRFMINSSGNVGIATTTPSEKLEVSGNVKATSFIGDGSGLTNIATAVTGNINLNGDATKVVSMDRHTTADTAGNNLTVNAGGATTGATDKNGGNLVLSSGTSTGSGSSKIEFQTSPSGASGTGDNTPVTAMTIDSTGQVGVGVTAPTSPLHISNSSLDSVYGNKVTEFEDGSGVYNGLVFSTPTSAPTGYIGGMQIAPNTFPGSGVADFLTHFKTPVSGPGSTRHDVAIDGNVGIGTTAPGRKLHIHDDSSSVLVKVESSNVFGSAIELHNSDTGGRNWSISSTGSSNTGGAGDFTIYEQSGGAERLTVQGTTGNVGIGTTAPTQALHIKSTSGVMILQDSNNLETDVAYTGWISGQDSAGTESWWVGEGSFIDKQVTLNAPRPGYGVMLSNDSGFLALADNGNVGIGTTTPGAKLDVAGEVRIYPTSGNAQVRFGENGIEKGKLTVDNTSNMLFETANIERVRIGATGNVGIGTTSPSFKLSIGDENSGGEVYVGAQDGVNEGAQINYEGAASFDNWATDIYDHNFRILTSSTNSNQVQIFNGGSGDAGLYVEGSVGIGTSSPTRKLEVVDDSTLVTYPISLSNDFGTTTDLAGTGIIMGRPSNPWGAIVGNQQKVGDYSGGMLLLQTETSDASGLETKMAINNVGNVGIGTTAPSEKLEVSGRILASSIKMQWTDKTSANTGDTLTTSDNIFINASTGSFSLNLPAAPSDGDEIRFVHSAGSLVTNNVTLVAGTGDTVVGDPTLVLDLDNISIDLIFYDVDGDGDGDWRLK